MEKGYKFIVDSREHSTTKQLVKVMKIPHEVQALSSADYALRQYDPYKDVVGIERKTVQDLVQSIQTQRLFKQMDKLVKAWDIPYLMISGNLETVIAAHRRRGFNVNTSVIYGTIASLSVRGAVQVMWFPSDRVLIDVAHRICSKVSEGKLGVPLRTRPKYRTFSPSDFLANFPGITRPMAQKMLTRFGSIRNIANASAQQLTVVPGVGDSKALMIDKFFARKD